MTNLWISKFSQQIKVSTEPNSKALKVSSTPKQYLPVSCEISSKYLKCNKRQQISKITMFLNVNILTYLPINFFSWMNFTFCKDSAANSIAWLKPFSPPYDTSTSLMILACSLYNFQIN